MQIQKYIVRVFLVVIAILFVSPVCIELQMQVHKILVAKHLDDNSHKETLHFTKDEWSKIEKSNSNECQLNGKMFDVSSVIIQKNEVQVLGQFDSFEDELIHEFVSFFNKGPLKDHSNIALFHFLFFEENRISIPNPNVQSTIVVDQHAKYLTSIVGRFDDLDAPPPKFV